MLKGALKSGLVFSFLLLFSLHAIAVECGQSVVMEHYLLDFENDQFLDEDASSGSEARVDLSGADDSNCQDFARGMVTNSLYNFDYTRIQFQGGDPSLRMAEIVDDPLNEDNKVLETWISEGWIRGGRRGRVQLSLYGANYSYKKLSYTVRLMIPESFRAVSSDNDIIFGFFTLGELFNKPRWTGEDNAFRVQYGLEKIQSEEEGVSRLRLRASGETRAQKDADWEVIWAEYNRDFEIPIGKWITLDITYIEGNEGEGLFTIEVARDGDQFEKVIGFAEDGSPDYRPTYDLRDPEPEGLRYVNPIKLYTNDLVLQELREKGVVARVLWDDYQLDPSSVITSKCFIHCAQYR